MTIQLSDVNNGTTPVSGIDLAGTGVQLLGPGNTPLGINTRDDGVDTIIASFASFISAGVLIHLKSRRKTWQAMSQATSLSTNSVWSLGIVLFLL